MKRVGVLYHPKKDASQDIASDIRTWLDTHAVAAWAADSREDNDLVRRITESDLIVTIGGDGSMLRVARMAAGSQTPIIGINMGRLGFLSELPIDDWQEPFSRILAGEYWIEKRMMLLAMAYRQGEQLGSYLALNDVVISRGAVARVVRLRVEIDGERFTTYVADGIIISTPTGSTAYALAAGGPILQPELRNILVLPIAPHLTLDRPVILAEGAAVRIQTRTDQRAFLTVDGQVEFELASDDVVEVHSSHHEAHFVRLGKRTYFYNALLQRLEPKQSDSVDW